MRSTVGVVIMAGGKRVDGPGDSYEPTVLIDVPANATEYGLASYVFTRDANRMWQLSDGLEFSLMGFNSEVISNAAAPFGEVNQSGLGRGVR